MYFNGTVRTIAKTRFLSYFGGEFTSYLNTPANKIIRLTFYDQIDEEFNYGTGFNDTVKKIFLQTDGKIIVGGKFTSYNGQLCNRIVRLNPDGTIDSSFNIGTGFNDDVEDINQDAEGKIFIGGKFTSYNGQTYNKIIYLNSDGTINDSFNIGTGFNDDVYKIAIDNVNFMIFVGGKFTSYNNLTQNRIVRLNFQGVVDSSFNIDNGFDDEVRAIFYYPLFNQIFIGGNFNSYKGLSTNKIICLEYDGSITPTFFSNIGFNDIVYDIVPNNIEFPTQILVGGKFSTYQNIPCNGLAKLWMNGDFATDPDCPEDSTILATCFKEQNISEENADFFAELSLEDFSFNSNFPGKRLYINSMANNLYARSLEEIGFLLGAQVFIGVPNSNKVIVYEIRAINDSSIDGQTGLWTKIRTKYVFTKSREIYGLASTDSLISKFGIAISGDNASSDFTAIAGAFYDRETNEPRSIYVIYGDETLFYELPPGLEYAGVSLNTVGNHTLMVGLPNLNKVIVYYRHLGKGPWEIFNNFVSPFLYKNIELDDNLNYKKDMAYGWDVAIAKKRYIFGRNPDNTTKACRFEQECNLPDSSTVSQGLEDTDNVDYIDLTNYIIDGAQSMLISDPFYKNKRGMVQSLYEEDSYKMRTKDGEWKGILNAQEEITFINKSVNTSESGFPHLLNRRAFDFCVASVSTSSFRDKDLTPGFYLFGKGNSITCPPLPKTGLFVSRFGANDAEFRPEVFRYSKWEHISVFQYEATGLFEVLWIPYSEIGDSIPGIISGIWTIRTGKRLIFSEGVRVEYDDFLYYSTDDVPFPWEVTTWKVVKDGNHIEVDCLNLIQIFGDPDFDIGNSCLQGPLPEEMPVPYNSIRSDKDLYRGSLIISPNADLVAMARNTLTYYRYPNKWYIEFNLNKWPEGSIYEFLQKWPSVRFKTSSIGEIPIIDKRIWRDAILTENEINSVSNFDSLYIPWDFLFSPSYDYDPAYASTIAGIGGKELNKYIRAMLLDDYYIPFKKIIGIDDRYAAMVASKNWGEALLQDGSTVQISPDGYKTILENKGKILVYNGENLTTINIVDDWVGVAMSEDGKHQTAISFDDILDIGRIYVSHNYGQTWEIKNEDYTPWRKIDMNLSGQFQTAVAKDCKIYVSHDYGDTWEQYFIENDWTGISLNGKGDTQLACSRLGVYESTDYGVSWELLTFFGNVIPRTSEWITTGLNKIVEKYNYIVSIITNSNSGFFSIDSCKNIDQISLSALSPNPFLLGNCKIGGSYDAVFQTIVIENGGIFISRNYGATWTKVNHPVVTTNKQWKDISVSENGKYQTAVAYNDKIYRSSNFGSSWTIVDFTNTWQSIKMNDSGQLQIAIADNDKAYISNDYGENWENIADVIFADDKNWRDVSISKNGEYQTIIANNDKIYTSNDFGLSWTEHDITGNWKSVDMSSNGQVQTVVGTNNQIYTSFNYGSTWTAKENSRNWIDVAINDDGDLQIAITNNEAYISYDYGTNWEKLNINGLNNCSNLFISKYKFNAKIVGPTFDTTRYDFNEGWRDNMQYGYKIELDKFNQNTTKDIVRQHKRYVGSIGSDDPSQFGTVGIITTEYYSSLNNTWRRNPENPDIYGEVPEDKIGMVFDYPAVGYNNPVDPTIKFPQTESFLFDVEPDYILTSGHSNFIGFNNAAAKNILAIQGGSGLRFFANECLNVFDFIIGCCQTDGRCLCWCCKDMYSDEEMCWPRFSIDYEVTSQRKCLEKQLRSQSATRCFDTSPVPCTSCEELFFNERCPISWEQVSFGCLYPGCNPEYPAPGGGSVMLPGFGSEFGQPGFGGTMSLSTSNSLPNQIDKTNLSQNIQTFNRISMENISLNEKEEITNSIINLINKKLNNV